VRHQVDILPVLKGEDSNGTAPLDWDIVVHKVGKADATGLAPG